MAGRMSLEMPTTATIHVVGTRADPFPIRNVGADVYDYIHLWCHGPEVDTSSEEAPVLLGRKAGHLSQ